MDGIGSLVVDVVEGWLIAEASGGVVTQIPEDGLIDISSTPLKIQNNLIGVTPKNKRKCDIYGTSLPM